MREEDAGRGDESHDLRAAPAASEVDDGAAAAPAEEFFPHPDADKVRAVSLGGWCGVKGVIREMGFQGANLPFDWLRCSLDGVIYAIQDDFKDFLSSDYVVSRCERDQPVSRDYLYDSADESILPFKDLYVAWGHAFWHDDLELDEEREKYQRRIDRFRELRGVGPGQPLLFVRAVNLTVELAGVHLLHNVLVEQFGERSHLLVMVNHQPSQCSIIFDDRPRLMVHTLGKQHDDEGLHGMKPLYREAIGCGLRFASVREVPAGHVRYASLAALLCDGRFVLLEDLTLGEDISKQWLHFPEHVELPGSGSMGLWDAVDRRRAGADVRRSPYDGKLYEFAGLAQACMPHWSMEEVESFWKDECSPLDLGEFVASGNPQEAAEGANPRTPSSNTSSGRLKIARLEPTGARSLALLPTTQADNSVVPGGAKQLRHNPYDGQVYTFEALAQECAQHWTHEEVKAFWDLNCAPLTTRSARLTGAGVAPGLLGADPGLLRVVSIGSHCGLKHALIKMGLSGATFPFDWLRTSLGSVLRALRTDFVGFLDYKQALPHYERPRVLSEEEVAQDDYTPFEVVYACDGHSLWHSICWDERDLASCYRRARRLLRLRSHVGRGPLLFVRAASSGAELYQLSEVMSLLTEQFGDDAYLLFMLSGQPSYEAVFFSDQPRLMVATLGSDWNPSAEYLGVIPLYREVIWDMLWYVQQGQRPKRQTELPSLGAVWEQVGVLFADNVDLGEDTTQRWTPNSLALPVLPTQGSPLCSVDSDNAIARGCSRLPPLPRTAAGETLGNAWKGFVRLRPASGGVRAVSLGGWSGVKAAIHELAFDKANLPFDWLRSSLDGVCHALRSDFSEFLRCDWVVPRSDGVQGGPTTTDFLSAGADGQRPLILDVTAVPDLPPRHEHVYVSARGWSFWYDDLTHEREREKYERRIKRFRELHLGTRDESESLEGAATENADSVSALLFVRAANATAELSGVIVLHDLLSRQFAPVPTYLLVLLSHQPSECTVFFDDYPTIIVHTFGRHSVDDELSTTLMPYTQAINMAHKFVLSGVRPAGHELFAALGGFLAEPRGLVEEAALNVDVSREWSLLPGGSRGGGSEADDYLVADTGQGGEIRRNPSDGRLYDLEGLGRICSSSWSWKEIAAFWSEECVPVHVAKAQPGETIGSDDPLNRGDTDVNGLFYELVE